MNLSLHFPGFSLRKCNIYHQNELYASVTRKGIFWQKAIAECQSYSWKLQETGFFHTKIQVIDLNTQQIIGEFPIKMLSISGSITVNNHTFNLSKKPHPPSQFVWTDSQGKELIHYDLTNLEKTVIYPFKFNRDGTASIPDNPNQNILALFLLGIFLHMLAIGRIPAVFGIEE